MALKAGYKGIKNNLLNKLKVLPFISSIGDGLLLEDGELSATGGGGGTTVVANPEAAATDDLTKLQVGSTVYGIPDITGKADITAIGTNETGTTASRAYAVGEHFYKDGKFCTAISAIAQNATFTLNTNYVEGTIADNMLKYVDVTIPAGTTLPNTSGDWYYTEFADVIPANHIGVSCVWAGIGGQVNITLDIDNRKLICKSDSNVSFSSYNDRVVRVFYI